MGSKVDEHQIRLEVATKMIVAHPELRRVFRDRKAVFCDPLNYVRAEILKKMMASDFALKKTLEFYVDREAPQ